LQRNTQTSLEINLRKIIIPILKSKYGFKIKEHLLSIKKEESKQQLMHYDVNTLVKDHFFFQELAILVNKNWDLFQNVFNDKVKFENFTEHINKYRTDAHAKEISDEDYALITFAFKWFDNSIEEMEGILDSS
jgi:hypothetical protein